MAAKTIKNLAVDKGDGEQPWALTDALLKENAVGNPEWGAVSDLIEDRFPFTALPDTPATYAAQALKFVKVKSDETGVEFADAPGGSGGLTGWTDAKADHSAVGDGVADDTTELQAALDSGAAVVYIPPGTYRITSSITVTPGTTLLGAGPGKTIIDATELPSELDPAAIFCAGTTVTLPILNAAISEGDKDIIFVSSVEASIQQWDMIGLVDKRDASFSSGGNAYRQGAFVCAHAIIGSKVILDSALPRDLPSPRIGGGTVNDVEAVVLDRRGVKMQGFRLDCRGLGLGITGLGTQGTGITCRHLSDVWLENVVVRGAPTYGVELDRCARGKVLGCRFSAHAGGWTGDAGYGFAVLGCAYVHAWGCYFGGHRKGLDVGTGGSDQPIRQCTAHDCIFDNCAMLGMAENVFVSPSSTVTTAGGCHPNCFNLRFSNSVFRGVFTLRGFGNAVVDNIITVAADSANPGILTDALGPRFGNTISRNHFIMFNSNNVIKYISDEHATTDPRGLLDISDNIFDIRASTTEEVINVSGGVEANLAYIKIHDNVVLSTNTQNFVEISSDNANYVRASILDNQLPGNVAFGTVANVSEWVGRNMIGGNIQFNNLPTSTPGGSGRLWSKAGALTIT